MKEVRCVHQLKNGRPCNKKLGEFQFVQGIIQCPRCKNSNKLTTEIENHRIPEETVINHNP